MGNVQGKKKGIDPKYAFPVVKVRPRADAVSKAAQPPPKKASSSSSSSKKK